MNRAQVAALVEDERVHRDLYLSEELFALEQKHFFANTWNYVGHASQVPNAGDYSTLDLAGRPLLMVRHDDGSVRVLYNRCAHKGTPLVSEKSGNTGQFFRCPYHAWTYRSTARRSPCRWQGGYEGTRLRRARRRAACRRRAGVAVYRDFVFAKLNHGRPRLRELLRRGAGVDRQPGRPLARRPAADRGRRACAP